MDITFIILIAAVTIGGSFIQRVSGFGFGIFVMAFFPYLLDGYGEATALSGILAGCTALGVTVRMFRCIEWRKLAPVLITYAITSVAAIHYLSGQDNGMLKRMLGAMMILLSLYFIFLSRRIRIRANMTNGLIVGACSGVMGGLFAMPGPPLVIYLIESVSEKKSYMASMQAASVLFNIYATCFRAQEGFLTAQVMTGWITGLAGVAIGIMAGARVFGKISPQTLKYVVYFIMAASGAAALLK